MKGVIYGNPALKGGVTANVAFQAGKRLSDVNATQKKLLLAF